MLRVSCEKVTSNNPVQYIESNLRSCAAVCHCNVTAIARAVARAQRTARKHFLSSTLHSVRRWPFARRRGEAFGFCLFRIANGHITSFGSWFLPTALLTSRGNMYQSLSSWNGNVPHRPILPRRRPLPPRKRRLGSDLQRPSSWCTTDDL